MARTVFLLLLLQLLLYYYYYSYYYYYYYYYYLHPPCSTATHTMLCGEIFLKPDSIGLVMKSAGEATEGGKEKSLCQPNGVWQPG